MKISGLILSAAALLLVLFAARVHADTVFVQVPQTEGEESNLRATVHELVKAAVSEQSSYSLANTAEAADLILRPRLLKLGSAFVLTIDKVKGGKVLFTAKMRASSAEDLDTVSSRVVRSALQESRAEANAQVDDVTEDEVTRGSRRHIATRQWKIGFGPTWGNNLNTDKSGLAFHLGFAWSVDPLWDLDLSFRATGIEGKTSSDAYFSEFMIGTNYHLNKNKNAPFLTGAIGRATAGASTNTAIIYNDDNANGWAARVGAGMKFFRTSTVNLGIEANYTHLFAETSGSKKSPGVTTLLLSLYY
jgi:hypothetical protein